MKQIIVLIVLALSFSLNIFACSCFPAWNNSFSKTIKQSEFVALVKVISFDEYLENKILEYEGKMPYSMTVEIIKKYKGNENRKKIRIYGDNGMMCRPYLSEFTINDYYLIAPNRLKNSHDTDYDFFVCRTEYLKVNIKKNIAFGNYSLIRKLISLKTFEKKLHYGDFDFIILGIILTLLILSFLVRKKIKNKKSKLQKLKTTN